MIVYRCPLSSGTFHILPYFPMNFSQLEPPKMVNLQHIPSHLQHSSHGARTLRTETVTAGPMASGPGWCKPPGPSLNDVAIQQWLFSMGKMAMKIDAMDDLRRFFHNTPWTNGQYAIYIWNTPSRLYDSFVRESCHVSWWNIPITSISYDTSFGNFSGRPTVDFLQKLAGLSRWFITPIFQCFGESPSTEGNFRFVDQSLFEFFSSSENPHVGRISHGF